MKVPNVEGYWWRIGPNYNGEIVTQVVEVKPIISTAPEELFYWECGEMGATYVKEELGTEWEGPIERVSQVTVEELEQMGYRADKVSMPDGRTVIIFGEARA